ncbi:hypothetical protein D3C81_863060 [compost metagenome]
MHRVEQGLAPEQVVLAQLGTDLRFVTDFAAHEHESIEHFAGRAAVVALGIVAQVRAAQRHAGARQAIEAGIDAGLVTVAVDERVAVGTGVVVGLVVPTGGADTKAGVALVDHVQLGQQVDAVGDVGTGLAEVVVTVVAVGGAEQALVGAFGTHAIVVLDGIVEANGPVFVAGVDFERLGARQREQADGTSEQAALWFHSTVSAMFWHYDCSTYCYCFLRRPSFAGVGMASLRCGGSAVQSANQCLGQGPAAKAGSRVEVADSAKGDQLAAPALGHGGGSGVAGQVIVAAGSDDAGKRQRLLRQGRPTFFGQGRGAGIVRWPLRVEVRRCCQQRAFDRALIAGGPVGHHQYAGAVRHQQHLAFDLLDLALDGFDAGVAVEAVDLQRRHATDLGQAGLEQRLPVLGDVVAQAGDDQHGGGGMQSFHV